jgi:predicted nuclease of predicted toxin-antitoxin system
MRFFLDNCLAIRHARALGETVKPEHSFTHLQEKFGADAKDEVWIRRLGEEGDWVVISGDYRIGRGAHERAAWHQSGLTVFFLSKGWTNIPPLQQS